MASVKGGEALAAKLAEVAKLVGNASAVRVGFLENASYPSGEKVAMIAAINEYGAPSRGQPPRPFFRQMIARHKDEWGPAIAGLLKANNYDALRTLQLTGEAVAGQLRQSIVDLVAPPLAASTIARKGFDKPLIDTGHMWQSVDYEVQA